MWRYDEPVMQIYHLSDDKYVPCNVSATFANLSLTTEIPRFMAETGEIGEITMIRSFRAWVKQQRVN